MSNIAVKTSGENKTAESQSLPTKRAEGSWPSLTGLRHEIDSLFDHFMRGFPRRGRSIDLTPLWKFETPFGLSSPAVDIIEKEKTYEVAAELPGLEAGDIEVSLSGDVLTIKGEKKEEKETKEKNYYLSERRYGSFQRSFHLPEGFDRDKVDANFEKGVLHISLPKLAKVVEQQKIIQVKSK